MSEGKAGVTAPARQKVLIATSRAMEARLISIMLSLLDVGHEFAATTAELRAACAKRKWGALLLDLDEDDIDVAGLTEPDGSCLRGQSILGMTDDPDLGRSGLVLGGEPAQVLRRPFRLHELADAFVLFDIPTRQVDQQVIESWVK